MKWFYFARQGRFLSRCTPAKAFIRPKDAQPAPEDDPFTPWYTAEDHFDEHHVHVQARDRNEAYEKAKTMLGLEVR